MTAFLLSILCSTLITLGFKAATRYRLNIFQTIVVNYWVCSLLGWTLLGGLPFNDSTWAASWLPFAIFLGSTFVGGFYLVGKTVELFGITFTAVLQRMSLILPVTFAILYYHEPFNWLKLLGIVVAFFSVFLSSHWKEFPTFKKDKKRPSLLIILPFVLFLTSGINEIILQFIQLTFFQNDNSPMIFTVLLFNVAALVGTIILLYQIFIQKIAFQLKSLIGGLAIGIPNLGSIYYLMEALRTRDGSVVFPINNVAVIVLSALFAVVFFQEKLSKFKLIGILLAVVAIVLIGFSDTIERF